MGDTIWVDTQGRGKDELPSDNSIMLRFREELDNLSDKLRVSKAYSSFMTIVSSKRSIRISRRVLTWQMSQLRRTTRNRLVGFGLIHHLR